MLLYSKPSLRRRQFSLLIPCYICSYVAYILQQTTLVFKLFTLYSSHIFISSTNFLQLTLRQFFLSGVSITFSSKLLTQKMTSTKSKSARLSMYSFQQPTHLSITITATLAHWFCITVSLTFPTFAYKFSPLLLPVGTSGEPCRGAGGLAGVAQRCNMEK